MSARARRSRSERRAGIDLRRKARRWYAEAPRRASQASRALLLMQVSYVALAEAEAIRRLHVILRWRRDEIPAAQQDRRRQLVEAAAELAGDARSLGFRGFKAEAFACVRAEAAPLVERRAAREELEIEIAQVIWNGGVLKTPTCTVGPYRRATDPPDAYRFAAFRDPGGVLLNEGALDAISAAGAFVGVRGAGEEAAREALKRWRAEHEDAGNEAENEGGRSAAERTGAC